MEILLRQAAHRGIRWAEECADPPTKLEHLRQAADRVRGLSTDPVVVELLALECWLAAGEHWCELVRAARGRREGDWGVLHAA